MFLHLGSQRTRGCARVSLIASVLGLVASSGGAKAQTLYWDINGTNPGATDSTTASGTWDTSSAAKWTTDPTGNSPTMEYSNGRPVVFSAGDDATGISTIDCGLIDTKGITIEEGTIVLRNGLIGNRGNPVLIKPGATFDVGTRFNSESNGTLTIDQSTFRGNWYGAAQISAINAVVDASTSSSSIAGAISLVSGATSGTLTKTGAETLTAGSTSAVTTLNVNGGTYRVTGSESGFGAVDGTVNIADGAKLFADVVATSPATRKFVVSGNGTFEAKFGGRWTINSPISGSGRISLNAGSSGSPGIVLAGDNTYAGSTTISSGSATVTGGKAIPNESAVVLGQASSSGVTLHVSSDETIGSLATASGNLFSIVELGDFSQAPAVTLIAGGDNSSTQFGGTLAGSGFLTKVGTGTLTLTSSALQNFGGLNVLAGRVQAGQLLNASQIVVGDGTSQAAALVARRSSPYSLAINGSNALLDLGISGSIISYTGLTLENAGTITGSGSANVFTGATFDVKSGTIDVPLKGQSGNGTGGTLNKTTAGIVTLNGLNTYIGGTNVAAGTLRVKRMQETNAVNLTGGTLQVMDSAPTLPATPTGHDTFVSRPSALTIANDAAPLGSRAYSAALDLTNNDLILDYTDATPNPTANVEDMVRSGYAGGTWLGMGITSSTAASPLAEGKWVLAVADNATLATPFGDGTTGPLFDGKSVDPTTTLVKFTYRVDLNLDGWMDETDMAIFQSKFVLGTPAVWATGDLDYDGLHTANDQALFDQYYAVVPEPGGLALLAPPAMMATRRSSKKWQRVGAAK